LCGNGWPHATVRAAGATRQARSRIRVAGAPIATPVARSARCGSKRWPVPFRLVATNTPPVQYKGADLDAERGPGLGCFRFQLIVLAILLVLTPLSVAWGWAPWLSTVLLISVLVLLLVAGQTIIFLLRLVAADRRIQRRPLARATKTVGELEDDHARAPDTRPDAPPDAERASPPDDDPVRQ
jgi:hypothetical protein